MSYPNAVATTAQRLFTLILAMLTIMLSSCDGGSGTKEDTSIPLEPTNLVAKGVNKGIDLSWKEAKGAESYTVYYHTASFDSTADGGILKQAGITKTKTIITGLTNGTKYYLRVAAINADGEAKLSTQIVSATANLQAPTNVIAIGRQGAIDLTWYAVNGADSYTVYYHTASFDKTTVSVAKSITGITSTNTSITGLTAGTKYYLQVEAINADRDKKLSKVVTATTKASATTNLEAPTNVIATGGDNAIDLSWGDVTGATSYKVYYRTASFSSTTESGAQSTNSVTTTSTIITGLAGGTKYYLRVEVINAKGDKKLSKVVTAYTNLEAPTKLRATGGDKIVDISWDAVTGATSYKVYYHTASFSSTTGVSVKTVQSPASSTSITGLTAGTKYYLRVEAINANNNGDKKLSTEIVTAFTNLEAPTKLKAIARDKIVDISWDAVTGATSYKVYYHTASFSSTTDNGVQSKTDITADNTSITGLLNGTKYFIRLVASNQDGDSALSYEVSAITDTELPAPINVIATARDKIVAISWDAVTGADSYKVYYRTASFSSTTDNGVQSKTDITADNTSITGLTNYTTYYLRVAAFNAKGETKLSKQVSATPALQAPILKATGFNKGVDLNWDAVADATSYTIYYHTASFSSTTDNGVQSKTDITADNTSIDNLINGKKYYFRAVTKYLGGGVSGLSEQVEVTADLQAPTNVIATGGDKIVDISWDAVTGATSYKVYYHTASFDKTTDSGVKSKTGIAATNTIIEDLNYTLYYLRVEAINAAGETKLSEEVSATTKLLALHPSAAASISLAAVDLSWDAIDGVTDYKIYYAKQSLDKLNGGYKNYATVGGKLETTTDTSITIGDLSADTTYYFVVTANYKGKEAAAPEVSAKSSYIAELAVGGHHSCVRLNTGSIKCWGFNGYGQLGVGDTYVNVITSVSGMRAKQLSAGYYHSCAIDLSDRLYCWGSNSHSQLGLSGGNRSIPTLVTQANLTKVSLVSAGTTSTCALAGGNNYCWGAQNDGGLGDGIDSDDPTMDAQVIDNITSDVKQFALGNQSGCAIDASADLWCWGNNDYGQVGDGTNTNRASPVKPKLKGSSTATTLDGINFHYCVVVYAGKVQCWGWNGRGQLGIDSTTDSNSPQYVLASPSKSNHLNNVSKIATGWYHSCALITGGKVRCWGRSNWGIIGTDATADRLVADIDMPDINNAIDIAAGFGHTCVLLADRARVKCWGRNDDERLGDVTTTYYSSTPVEVKGL